MASNKILWRCMYEGIHHSPSCLGLSCCNKKYHYTRRMAMLLVDFCIFHSFGDHGCFSSIPQAYGWLLVVGGFNAMKKWTQNFPLQMMVSEGVSNVEILLLHRMRDKECTKKHSILYAFVELCVVSMDVVMVSQMGEVAKETVNLSSQSSVWISSNGNENNIISSQSFCVICSGRVLFVARSFFACEHFKRFSRSACSRFYTVHDNKTLWSEEQGYLTVHTW